MTTTINGSAGLTTNSGAVYDGLQSGTAVTASGTSVDFTDIPSWVKRITVMFAGMSTNGTSHKLIQLGDSGGIENTGYVSTSSYTATGAGTISSTAGHIMFADSATDGLHGIAVFTLINDTTWVGTHTARYLTNSCSIGGSSKTLSATLDRIRITTVNGTDTFDAGTINIIYE